MGSPLGTNTGIAQGVVERLRHVLDQINNDLNTFEQAAQAHIAGWEGNSYTDYLTAKAEWDGLMADAYAKLNKVPPLVNDMSHTITDADVRGAAVFHN